MAMLQGVGVAMEFMIGEQKDVPMSLGLYAWESLSVSLIYKHGNLHRMADPRSSAKASTPLCDRDG
jgi:hypothetical protein